jgi:hypothetical protein
MRTYWLLLFFVVACSNPTPIEEPLPAYKSDIERARSYWKKGNPDDAVATLEGILSAHPNMPEKSNVQAMLDSARDERDRRIAVLDSIGAVESIKRDSIAAVLLKSVRVSKDEFKGVTFYQAKTTPQYTNRNSFHIYLARPNSGTTLIRLRMQYKDDDWLFIKKAQMKVGDKIFSIDSQDWERDNGSGEIWEWLDRPLSTGDLGMLRAIVDNPSTIRYTGDKYHDERKLSETERKNIELILNLFQALGGDFAQLPD